MKFLFVLFIKFFLMLSLIAQENKEVYSSLILENDPEVIKLEKDLSYYYMTASNSYLAWYEGYTNKVYYKNLLNEEIINLKFEKGRGPNEILSLRGLAIVNNHLFILDTQNKKVLKFNLKEGNFDSEMQYGRNRINYITSSNNNLFGKGASRNGIYFEIDFDKEAIIPLKNFLTEEEIIELTKNVFRFEGPFLANSEFLVSVRKYEPTIFIQKQDESFVDFQYDKANFEPEYEVNEYGMATRPPEKVSMRLYSAALKPNSTIVYLVREGYTEKFPENDRSTLYLYDFALKEYVGTLDTKVESIREITTNDKYLFIYDDKNFSITRIEL